MFIDFAHNLIALRIFYVATIFLDLFDTNNNILNSHIYLIVNCYCPYSIIL